MTIGPKAIHRRVHFVDTVAIDAHPIPASKRGEFRGLTDVSISVADV